MALKRIKRIRKKAVLDAATEPTAARAPPVFSHGIFQSGLTDQHQHYQKQQRQQQHDPNELLLVNRMLNMIKSMYGSQDTLQPEKSPQEASERPVTSESEDAVTDTDTETDTETETETDMQNVTNSDYDRPDGGISTPLPDNYTQSSVQRGFQIVLRDIGSGNTININNPIFVGSAEVSGRNVSLINNYNQRQEDSPPGGAKITTDKAEESLQRAGKVLGKTPTTTQESNDTEEITTVRHENMLRMFRRMLPIPTPPTSRHITRMPFSRMALVEQSPPEDDTPLFTAGSGTDRHSEDDGGTSSPSNGEDNVAHAGHTEKAVTTDLDSSSTGPPSAEVGENAAGHAEGVRVFRRGGLRGQNASGPVSGMNKVAFGRIAAPPKLSRSFGRMLIPQSDVNNHSVPQQPPPLQQQAVVLASTAAQSEESIAESSASSKMPLGIYLSTNHNDSVVISNMAAELPGVGTFPVKIKLSSRLLNGKPVTLENWSKFSSLLTKLRVVFMPMLSNRSDSSDTPVEIHDESAEDTTRRFTAYTDEKPISSSRSPGIRGPVTAADISGGEDVTKKVAILLDTIASTNARVNTSAAYLNATLNVQLSTATPLDISGSTEATKKVLYETGSSVLPRVTTVSSHGRQSVSGADNTVNITEKRNKTKSEIWASVSPSRITSSITDVSHALGDTTKRVTFETLGLDTSRTSTYSVNNSTIPSVERQYTTTETTEVASDFTKTISVEIGSSAYSQFSAAHINPHQLASSSTATTITPLSPYTNPSLTAASLDHSHDVATKVTFESGAWRYPNTISETILVSDTTKKLSTENLPRMSTAYFTNNEVTATSQATPTSPNPTTTASATATSTTPSLETLPQLPTNMMFEIGAAGYHHTTSETSQSVSDPTKKMWAETLPRLSTAYSAHNNVSVSSQTTPIAPSPASIASAIPTSTAPGLEILPQLSTNNTFEIGTSDYTLTTSETSPSVSETTKKISTETPTRIFTPYPSYDKKTASSQTTTITSTINTTFASTTSTIPSLEPLPQLPANVMFEIGASVYPHTTSETSPSVSDTTKKISTETSPRSAIAYSLHNKKTSSSRNTPHITSSTTIPTPTIPSLEPLLQLPTNVMFEIGAGGYLHTTPETSPSVSDTTKKIPTETPPRISIAHPAHNKVTSSSQNTPLTLSPSTTVSAPLTSTTPTLEPLPQLPANVMFEIGASINPQMNFHSTGLPSHPANLTTVHHLGPTTVSTSSESFVHQLETKGIGQLLKKFGFLFNNNTSNVDGKIGSRSESAVLQMLAGAKDVHNGSVSPVSSTPEVQMKQKTPKPNRSDTLRRSAAELGEDDAPRVLSRRMPSLARRKHAAGSSAVTRVSKQPHHSTPDAEFSDRGDDAGTTRALAEPDGGAATPVDTARASERDTVQDTSPPGREERVSEAPSAAQATSEPSVEATGQDSAPSEGPSRASVTDSTGTSPEPVPDGQAGGSDTDSTSPKPPSHIQDERVNRTGSGHARPATIPKYAPLHNHPETAGSKARGNLQHRKTAIRPEQSSTHNRGLTTKSVTSKS